MADKITLTQMELKKVVVYISFGAQDISSGEIIFFNIFQNRISLLYKSSERKLIEDISCPMTISKKYLRPFLHWQMTKPDVVKS